MHFVVVTLFPELFEPALRTGMVGRAIEAGRARVTLRQLREFGLGRHQSVDDTPYGGGSGMVLRVDVVVGALEAVDADLAHAGEPVAHRVLLSPQGRPLDQPKVMELSERAVVALVCGRYEGFDERVRDHVHEEISLGDFVLTGGEIAAMAVIDACARQLPGVLGNERSTSSESHSAALGGLLEYEQYTRPADFRGREVPEVLRGGNHAAIETWRRERAEARTKERRPDLWARYLAGSGGPPREDA